MKLVNQKAELWQQGPTEEDMWDHIAKCTRVCYQSTPKNKEESGEDFCKRTILLNKHYGMLEHGTVYLIMPYDEDHVFTCKMYGRNPYSKVRLVYDKCYITTNYRVILENNREADLDYWSEPTEFHEKRYTLSLITSIGIGRELCRHRRFSFSQESTRYVSSCTKRNISEFNCDNLEDIIAAYTQGFSMREIAEHSSVSESTIYTKLKQNNVPIRGLHSMGNREEDYFSTVDTPEKAYLIGLIQTDGSIAVTDRNAAFTITQHKDYIWYIKCMLQCFSDKVTQLKDENCMQMQIGSKKIVEDLINIGIVPNKTRRQTDEDINKLWQAIPEEFKGDFIRGLIDGDGWVSYFTQKKGINESCNIGFCSVKESLVDLLISYIKDKFDYSCGKDYQEGIYRMRITDKNKSIEIGKFLYKNFKYPFGHPKKAASWIKRINEQYPIADFKDPSFIITTSSWVQNSDPCSIFNYVKSLNTAEDTYTSLRMGGLKAQDAREVLPLALKSQLIMTGFENDWRDFLDKRLKETTGRVHPDMLTLAGQIQEQLKLEI